MEARTLLDEKFMTSHHGMRYLTLGSLLMDFNCEGKVDSYYRDLNLEGLQYVFGVMVWNIPVGYLRLFLITSWL